MGKRKRRSQWALDEVERRLDDMTSEDLARLLGMVGAAVLERAHEDGIRLEPENVVEIFSVALLGIEDD